MPDYEGITRPENELFEMWRAGDEGERQSTLPFLIEEMRKHARAVIWNVLHETKPDIENQAVWQALDKAPEFRDDAKFSTWFHQIVSNLCHDTLREKYRNREVALEEDSGLVLNLEDAAVTRLDVDKLMGSLEDGEVELLGLLAQGYTCEEIGSMQGVSMQAVSKQRARLQEKARRLWDGGL